MTLTNQEMMFYLSLVSVFIAFAAFFGNRHGRKKDERDREREIALIKSARITTLENTLKNLESKLEAQNKIVWKKLDSQEETLKELKDIETGLKVLQSSFVSLENSFNDIKSDIKQIRDILIGNKDHG